MARTSLRLYLGPDEQLDCDIPRPSRRSDITLNVCDVLPLLKDAVDCERTWLRDFERDEITISADLYEVLLAYQHFRRPSA